MNVRMGKPGRSQILSPRKRSQPRELKHLSTWRKRNQSEIPQVAASERGRAQTSPFRGCGVVGQVWGIVPHDVCAWSRSELERSATAGESPVGEHACDV